MQLPKVSIITITYNHENYILDTIKGVFIQQYNGPIEFIIANDNSPDNTDTVIKNYLNEVVIPDNIEIKYTAHTINKGISNNFTWALQQATGKYIAMCEGDDYWIDPLKLQKQVDFLENNSDFVMCFHKIKILNTNSGEIVDDFITKVPKEYKSLINLISNTNYIHTPSVVFKNVIKKMPFEFSYTKIGDYFLYIILGHHGDYGYIEDEMAIYRYGSGFFSNSTRVDIIKNNISLSNSLLSYLDNPILKEILLKRQESTINSLEKVIHLKYKKAFVSDNLIFKILNFILKNKNDPKVILKKIKMTLK